MDKGLFTELMTALVCDALFSGRTVLTKDMLLEVMARCRTIGGVLITGGIDDNDDALHECTILKHDGRWWGVKRFNDTIFGHSMTTLLNNDILLIGGYPSRFRHMLLKACYTYSRLENDWHEAGELCQPRLYHSAVTLHDGKVMIAGGHARQGEEILLNIINSIEFFDPDTRTCTLSSEKILPRLLSYHCAIVLLDGNVLFIGGITKTDALENRGYVVTAKCFIYKPQDGTFTDVASMKNSRNMHAAVLLPDGNVLVTGGRPGVANDAALPTNSCEIYYPKHDMWLITTPMNKPRACHCCFLTATDVLVIGGRTLNAFGTACVTSFTGEGFNYETREWTTYPSPPREVCVQNAACARFL